MTASTHLLAACTTSLSAAALSAATLAAAALAAALATSSVPLPRVQQLKTRVREQVQRDLARGGCGREARSIDGN